MPGMLEDRFCPSCGQTHNLCSPDLSIPEHGILFEYVCPVSCRPVQFTTDDWNRFDVVAPAGFIPLHRMGIVAPPGSAN